MSILRLYVVLARTLDVSGSRVEREVVWKFFDEHTSFLDHVIGVAFNVNASRTKVLLRHTEKCSNHEFLLEQLKDLPEWKKPHAKTVAWSHDMEGHAIKCVERYCELANKKGRAVAQSYNSKP